MVAPSTRLCEGGRVEPRAEGSRLSRRHQYRLSPLSASSAAPYDYRRRAVRQTYLTYAPAHNVIARFLISTTNATSPREEGDVLYLPSGGSLLRNISPLISLVNWLQYATTHAPFNTARFLLKVDDDAFIHLPEVASWMRLLDRSQDQEPIYFGRCRTAYDGPNFHPLRRTSPTLPPTARQTQDGTNHTCAGPFPYATGSLQGLSRKLAADLVASPKVSAHVDHAKEYFTKYHSRKTPAYEDAWLGYAIYGGLMREPSPPSPPRRIVSVLIHPIFFFDDLRFAMNNLTTIVHWRSGKTQGTRC